MKTSEILAVNGPVYLKIDRMITEAARSYAARREGGASESMNGALDYTAMAICELICKAAGEELVWTAATQ